MKSSFGLGPRSSERPIDAGVTSVGVFGHPVVAEVDGGGAVGLVGSTWCVDWWIGADDRWYLPSREASVRQRRVGVGPVLETAVRIPSGDALCTAYAANHGNRAVTVIEIRNESPVPVALALAVRPYSVTTSASQETSESPEISINAVSSEKGSAGNRESSGLAVASLSPGGQLVRARVVFPRPANQLGMNDTHDLFKVVTEGHDLNGTSEANGPEANAVALYPLPHRTSLRFVVMTEQPAESTVSAPWLRPADLPPAESIANGWDALVDGSSRFEIPDGGLSSLAGASQATLLLNAPETQVAAGALDGAVLRGLATAGFSQEVERLLNELSDDFVVSIDDPVSAATTIDGAAYGAALVAQPAIIESLLEPIAQLTKLVERSKHDEAMPIALNGLARLLLTAGQIEPAGHLLFKASKLTASTQTNQPPAADQLPELAEQASSAGRWAEDDVSAAAEYWWLARNSLLSENFNDRDLKARSVSLDLLAHYPHAWRGGNVEVHQAPTLFGPLSYAIRWHGYRPALLWDFEPANYLGDLSVELRCPGLDPTWSTTIAKGETLLAGTEEDLPEPPGPGDSFV